MNTPLILLALAALLTGCATKDGVTVFGYKSNVSVAAGSDTRNDGTGRIDAVADISSAVSTGASEAAITDTVPVEPVAEELEIVE